MPKHTAFSHWGMYTLGLIISLTVNYYTTLLFTNVADHKVVKINFDIFTYFKSFIRLCLSALHYKTNADGMQAVTDDGWPRYSFVFPKAKKGDHVIKKIITQASRGGYDVDGALEVRGCTFLLLA